MRRRPLLFLAAAYTAAVITEHYLGTAAFFCAGAIVPVTVLLINRSDCEKKSGYGNDRDYGNNRACTNSRDCRTLKISNKGKRSLFAWLVIVSYFSGGLCYLYHDSKLDMQRQELMKCSVSVEDTSVIIGNVKEVEKKTTETGEQYLQMVVKSENGNVLVSYYGDEGENVIPGSAIEACGTISVPPARRNPGCFDYRLYLKSRDIPVTMTARSIDVNNLHDNTDDTAQAHPNGRNITISGRLYLIKESFIQRISKSADGDTAALMNAIMFGDKGELDEEELETFQRNGTAHILAVSGLHIGIIYAFILKIWIMIGKITGNLICGRRGIFFFFFNIAFFGCYTIMADFSPSVVRAVIMVFIHIMAQLTSRRYDLSSASLLVLMIVLAVNPFMLFNAGFQMSFLAVLTMVLVLPFIKHLYSGIFLSSLVVQIGLGPFIIWSFNYLSLLSVFINVPVIFLAGLIVPAGLGSMALTGLPLFDVSAKAVQLLCRALEWINDVAEISGVTTFQIPSPPLSMLAFYYLALLILATEEGRLAVIRAAGAGTSALGKFRAGALYVLRTCAVLVTVAVAFAYVAGDHFEDCNLTFVDVGQGDCMCLNSDGGLLTGKETYLIDGGGNLNYNIGKKTLRSYLLKNGMSHVDGAFVTHLHTDHYKGICELCREQMVDRLYVYEGNRPAEKQILEDTGLSHENIEYVRSGQIIGLGKGGLWNRHEESVEVLRPGRKTDSEYAAMLKDEDNENAMSLILRIHFRSSSILGGEDETELLVTGDIDEEGESELIEKSGADLCSTILKVAHHGSKYSSSEQFLSAVHADYAVIQVGKNNYGHPADKTLERLDACGADVYRNDLQGAIGFEIKRGKVKKIRTVIEKP